MRRAHFIKRNHGTETPCHAVWFDTETDQHNDGKGTLTHELNFGWAAYARKRSNGKWTKPTWHRFTDIDGFFIWIETITLPKTKLYMFCHNTSFDIPVLDAFRQLALRGWVMSMACIDAPPTIVKLRKVTTTIVILDTLNIFRMSLKALGESIGLAKYDMPVGWTDQTLADRYCKRDVEIIMTAMIKWWDFIKENDLGGFANTLAGQALRSFRHRFMQHQILIDNNEESTGVSRKSYYGGRTECFMIGHFKNHLTLLDINSMYPSVMYENLYPTRLIKFKRGHVRQKDIDAWSDRLLCSRVTINTPEPVYPLRTKSALLFPVGRFVTYLSTPELMYAMEHGHIESWHETAVYESAQLFKPFVSYFTNKRIEAQHDGRKVDSVMFKTLGNSLYGKFGQRGLMWEAQGNTDDLSCKSWEELDVDTGKVCRFRQLGGLVQQQFDDQESRDSFPAIASHVTSYARLLLWNMINTAGRSNVYYVDTDSLLVNNNGLDRLKGFIDPYKLGFLKVEGEYDDVEIFGSKDYRFGEKERHKGVKKNAVWKDKNGVEQDQWSSLKGLISTGSISKPTTKRVTKDLKRVYNKGIKFDNGIVMPYEVNGMEGFTS